MGRGEEVFGSLYDSGEVVFRQGDQGRAMYLVQSGTVRISREGPGGSELLAELGSGDFFGELALLGTARRTASAVASTPARLLPVTQASLLERVARDKGVALHLIDALCRRIDQTTSRLAASMNLGHSSGNSGSCLFTEGSAAGIDDSLLSDLRTAGFTAGEVILREGEPGEEMYILLEGQVEITRRVDDGEVVVSRRGRNEVFGEAALVTGGPRNATVRAVESTRVIVMDRAEFFGRLDRDPELALFVLQVLVGRLQQTLSAADSPSAAAAAPSAGPVALPSGLLRRPTLRVALVSLASCSGCVASLIDEPGVLEQFVEGVELVYCPLLVDADEIGQADLALVEGAVRTTEHEEKLRDLRAKTSVLAAWGSCATHGGLPAMANELELEDLIAESYGGARDTFGHYLSGSAALSAGAYSHDSLSLLREARPVHDCVRVDAFVPGCPPPVDLLFGLLDWTRGSESRGQAGGSVCKECTRKPSREPAGSLTFAVEDDDGRTCLTSLGAPCLGFLTRGGCGASCTRRGLACWGCRGVSAGTVTKMKAGDSLVQVALAALSRRCKVPEEELRPLMRALATRGSTMLGLDHRSSRDEGRLL